MAILRPLPQMCHRVGFAINHEHGGLAAEFQARHVPERRNQTIQPEEQLLASRPKRPVHAAGMTHLKRYGTQRLAARVRERQNAEKLVPLGLGSFAGGGAVFGAISLGGMMRVRQERPVAGQEYMVLAALSRGLIHMRDQRRRQLRRRHGIIGVKSPRSWVAANADDNDGIPPTPAANGLLDESWDITSR